MSPASGRRGAEESLPRLHVISTDALLAALDWRSRATAVLEAGGASVALHLRGRETDGAVLFAHTAALLPEAERTGATLIVNDRIDVALAASAHGVQLGSRSLPVPVGRAQLGGAAWIGASVHSRAELDRAVADGADFALLGTLFPTPSHEGLPGMGLGGLRDAIAAFDALPVIGIGGIGPDEAGPVVASGVYGVAAIRGVWDAADPAEAIHDYLTAIEGAIE